MERRPTRIQAADPQLIAPCGLNCGRCRAYLRERQPCPGCRAGDENKANACLTCAIRNCRALAAGHHEFCFSCDDYACEELLQLDDRYRAKYRVSVIENLERIKVIGVAAFCAEDTARWACPNCGALLCMHKPECLQCGLAW